MFKYGNHPTPALVEVQHVQTAVFISFLVDFFGLRGCRIPFLKI